MDVRANVISEREAGDRLPNIFVFFAHGEHKTPHPHEDVFFNNYRSEICENCYMYVLTSFTIKIIGETFKKKRFQKLYTMRLTQFLPTKLLTWRTIPKMSVCRFCLLIQRWWASYVTPRKTSGLSLVWNAHLQKSWAVGLGSQARNVFHHIIIAKV